MNFFGIGPMELVFILILALIIFGPGRLPEIGRAVGKSIRDFRAMTQEVTSQFSLEDLEEAVKAREARASAQGTAEPSEPSEPSPSLEAEPSEAEGAAAPEAEVQGQEKAGEAAGSSSSGEVAG